MIMPWVMVFVLCFLIGGVLAVLGVIRHVSIFFFCIPFVLLLTAGFDWLFPHIPLVNNCPSTFLRLLAFAAGILSFIVIAWIAILGGGLVKGFFTRLFFAR